MLYCDGSSKHPSTEGTNGDLFLIPSSELGNPRNLRVEKLARFLNESRDQQDPTIDSATTRIDGSADHDPLRKLYR
jgi:hypothetical protein